ncbi:SH3 domain-containing protein [Streptomyces bambusae]|uniref:SH3 domain-containing protein n=1 Tax=Streptomyces bambusae TaxID=1550616 RepID=A0ABS6Z5I7_9ACTN|nr:SH3 domain-containing protein [Streptomyces bambusae]MBW5483014.1 SH3 domain-containing protein [Streptomyces bambusae]
MLQPTRTCFALAAGSLVLGLVGAGVAVADQDPPRTAPGHAVLDDDDDYDEEDEEDDEEDDYDEDDGRHDGDDGDDGSHDHGRPHHTFGKVVSSGPLNVRDEPTTRSGLVEKVYPHEKVAIKCKTRGETVSGNNIWYRLPEHDGWVAARWVKNLSPVKWCH